MDKVTLRNTVPGLEQGKTYHIGRSHPDVNGRWDGYGTWFVHYTDEDTEKERLIAYVAIGEYYDIGDGGKGSRFEVVRKVVDLMESGITPDAVDNVIAAALLGGAL